MDRTELFARQDALEDFRRSMPPGSPARLFSRQFPHEGVIPTGSLALDAALGTGGYPLGRVIEIYGSEASGKTTLALHAAANCQRFGGSVAYIDTEHALDSAYATALGVNDGDFVLCRPENGEQAMEIADALVASVCVDLLIVDSVAALPTPGELAGIDGRYAELLHANLLAKWVERLAAKASRFDTCLLFLNQLRSRGNSSSYGTAETTTGGPALKCHSSVRVELKTAGLLSRGGAVRGIRIEAHIIKNRLASPFFIPGFDIVFGEGICRAADLFDLALDQGQIGRSQDGYHFRNECLGVDREQATATLAQRPVLLDELDLDLRQSLRLPQFVARATRLRQQGAAAAARAAAI